MRHFFFVILPLFYAFLSKLSFLLFMPRLSSKACVGRLSCFAALQLPSILLVFGFFALRLAPSHLLSSSYFFEAFSFFRSKDSFRHRRHKTHRRQYRRHEKDFLAKNLLLMSRPPNPVRQLPKDFLPFLYIFRFLRIVR